MKKIISLILATLMLATVFAGCGKKEETKEKIVMGTNAAFAPYEYVDDNGNIVGIDAEIATLIAEKLGMELEIQDMDFVGLIPAVQSGKVDFAMAGMTVNEERLLSVNFSDTYAKGVQVIIVKEGSDIKTADDLEGKKIGVQSGTTGASYCTDDFGQENVKEYDNGSVATAALLNGQVDCVVIDNEPAKNYVKTNTGLKILDTAYADEDYAIAVAKTNNDLLTKINAAIKELKAEGKVDEILNKYIK